MLNGGMMKRRNYCPYLYTNNKRTINVRDRIKGVKKMTDTNTNQNVQEEKANTVTPVVTAEAKAEEVKAEEKKTV